MVKPATRADCRIRAARTGDRTFILSLAPRFVTFKLPRGRRKRDAIAATRGNLERALDARAPGEHIFVAEDSARVPAGFLRLIEQRDFFSGARACHISDLAVTLAYTHHGIGRALLAYAEAWARKHGCRWLTLGVFVGNARARELYARTGFRDELLRMAKPLR